MDSSNLAAIIVAGLAVARLTALIVDDSILEPLRHRIFLLSPPAADGDLEFYRHVDRRGIRLGSYKTISEPRKLGFLGRLVSCPYCVGVWIAAAALLGHHLSPEWTDPIIVVAAVAQVSDTVLTKTR